MSSKLRVLVAGCGNMGASHARAYHESEDFEICGLVSRGKSKEELNTNLGAAYPLFGDYYLALEQTQPDAVCISTYPDTHEPFSIAALEKGCHVFLEKPLADTLEGAERIAEAAKQYNKKILVGYILRYHPSWKKFIEISHDLGKPLVMRMNLNQQSQGRNWEKHRSLLDNLSPMVDCGVHYIDVMCQMTRSRPVRVSAIGAALSKEVPSWNYNYGQLQIVFEDGSVGWYEVGWGPMMSQTAFFVKDVIGPKGCVSIVAKEATSEGRSDDISAHTATESLRIHYADLNEQQQFLKPDTWVDMSDEPDHQELCNREQAFFHTAIREDIDLSGPTADAVNSLRIALACDRSVRTGETIVL